MTIGAILLSFALLVVVVAFVTRPLWMPESIPAEIKMTREQALEAQKAVLLDQIRALDFDLETGKIPQSVHETQRGRLMAQAAEILKELDSLDEGYGAAAMPEEAATLQLTSDAAIVAEIEAAIARIRETRASPEPVAEPARA